MSLNTCININFPEVLALSKELGLAPIVVGAKLQVWQSRNNDYSRFPTSEELQSGVNFTFKALQKIGENLNKVQNLWKKIPNKTEFWNKIQSDLQIPKEQIELLKQTEGNTIEEIVLNFATNYSYTVEINISKESLTARKEGAGVAAYQENGKYYVSDPSMGISNEITKQEYDNWVKRSQTLDKPTQYYSNLTVPGGTNGSYIEANIETPLITPSIKGHSQFSTDTSIGWYRMDEKQQYQEKDIENLIEIMKKSGILKVNCE